jgi:hypothetical protein
VLHSQLDKPTRSATLLRLLADPALDVRTRALALVLEGSVDSNLLTLMSPTLKQLTGEAATDSGAASAVNFDTLSDEQLQLLWEEARSRALGAAGKQKHTRKPKLEQKASLARSESRSVLLSVGLYLSSDCCVLWGSAV